MAFRTTFLVVSLFIGCVSVMVLTGGLATAGRCLTGCVCIGFIEVDSEETVSAPVCPNPLIIKQKQNKKQMIDFTQDDYGAKIYG